MECILEWDVTSTVPLEEEGRQVACLLVLTRYTEANLKGAFQWDEQAVGSVSLAPGTTAFPEKALAVWRSIKA